MWKQDIAKSKRISSDYSPSTKYSLHKKIITILNENLMLRQKNKLFI